MCKQIVRVFSLLLPLLLPVISYAGTSSVEHEGLRIKLTYDVNSVKKAKDSYFLYGKLEVVNTSGIAKTYGNKFLYMSVNENESRTYKDTIASDVIDFSAVNIPAGGELNLNVYWVFNSPVSTLGNVVKVLWHD